MNETLFPLHRRIFWLVILLLLLGQIALFSASGVLGIQRHQSEFYFVLRQLAAAGAGLAILFLISRFNFEHLRKMAFPLMLLQITLVAMTYIGKFGHNAGGATRWLRIGGFLFQPSELGKITVAIYFAHLLAKYKEQGFPVKRWIFYAMPVVVLLGLIFKQPDMGTTVLIITMMFGMAFIAGVRLIYLGGFLSLGAIGFATAMLHSEYRRKRFFAFLNPWADPQGTGFQTIQSFLSFHSGRLFGTGLGNGNSKLFFLPEVHTDFIFALIGEELGFAGAVFILLLFIYLTYLLFKVCFKAPSQFGILLAFGTALSLAMQIAVNLGGVTGILPVKGLPLPFISWGRSALIVNLSMIGILLSILRKADAPKVPRK